MQIDLELFRRTVTVSDNTRISLIEISPQAPLGTLIFLHGFGGNARQWQYQVEAFADRYRVIVPDIRGHGRSLTPATDFSMQRLLADLEELLTARKVQEPFVLAGHSFGGAIATDFVLAHPEKVSRLLLIATTGEYEIVWLYRQAFLLPAPVLAAFQPLVKRLVRASAVSLKHLYWQTLYSWRGWDKYGQLRVPALVITGERDAVFPRATFERVGELIPDAEVINVGASAHMVMLERRDAVNRAIERFIEVSQRFAGWRDDMDPGISRLLAERPWLVHYESGVPHTIAVPRLTMTRLFDRAVERFPSRPAMYFQGKQITYHTMGVQVKRLAAALHAQGIAAGDRVIILLPNLPHLVIAYHAILRLGAVVVMCNPRAEESDLISQAQESGAESLITLAQFQKKALAIKGRSQVNHVIYAEVLDYLPFVKRLALFFKPAKRAELQPRVPLGAQEVSWRTLLRHRSGAQLPELEQSPEELAMIPFTGGTTDRPKGIMLSHRNLVANTFQTRAWLTDAHEGNEVILCAVPFSHVYGMTAGMNLAISLGAAMVLLPTFEVREVLEHIRKYRPGFFPGVPPMYMAINRFPDVRRYDIESIRACLCGAAPLPIEVKERFEKLTKGKLVEGYGLSEATTVTHANPLYGMNRTGSIGIPVPNTEARIIDLQTGVPLPPGQVGELIIRGPQVMMGYWGNPEAVRTILTEDGWLHTNDVARMDEDGYFQIISRRQDVWQTDDRSIAFPRDVEEVIYELPQVQEVVVVGIANRPVAFVCVEDGAWLPARTIIAYCERRLPADRVPRKIIFVREFPRTLIGKVLRRELVSAYAQRVEAAGAGTVGEHMSEIEPDEPAGDGAQIR